MLVNQTNKNNINLESTHAFHLDFVYKTRRHDDLGVLVVPIKTNLTEQCN